MNGDDQKFLQSDLLPSSPGLSLSRNYRNPSMCFDKEREEGGWGGGKRQITAQCNQHFITVLRK
jgi:hypothetical protein